MSLQSFASRLPVFAAVLVCKLLVISGIVPLFHWFASWTIRKLEER
jgi:hypothetical protein